MADMLKNVPGSTSETRVTDFITVLVGLACIIAGMIVWIITGRDLPAGLVTLVGLALGASKAGKVTQAFAENRPGPLPVIEDKEDIKGVGHE